MAVAVVVVVVVVLGGRGMITMDMTGLKRHLLAVLGLADAKLPAC